MIANLRKVAVLSMLALKLAAAQDTESPNEPIPKPECDVSIPVSIRYSSASSRLYLVSADGSTRGGCVTLGQIWEGRGGKAPLYAVNPESGDISDSATGTWLLTEELFVQDGITLQVNTCVSLLLCFSRSMYTVQRSRMKLLVALPGRRLNVSILTHMRRGLASPYHTHFPRQHILFRDAGRSLTEDVALYFPG